MTSTSAGVETTSAVRRLYPDPGPTAIVDQVHELDLISNALQSGEGLVEIQYIIEELSGAENGESEMFAEQLGQLRERHFPECDAMVCEEEEALA